ncbi:MAG: hypothetical protein KGJ36_06315 [Acidobacteriota bacterium]|nr:hypothetical protein [Acidobacteriota bacterium]
MTTTPDLLEQLRREWRHVGRGPQSRRSFAGFAERHGDLAIDGLSDLGEVVAALETRGGRTVIERARIVGALLEDARDPMVRRCLLQTLLPGIVSVCRQLRFGAGIVRDPAETLAVAVAFASELLCDWAGQSRAYAAPDLLSALRGRLRRWLLKEKAARRLAVAFDAAREPAEEASPLVTRLSGYRGGDFDRLARLTYARVFEGRSLRDLAREDHCAPQTLQAELRSFALEHLL